MLWCLSLSLFFLFSFFCDLIGQKKIEKNGREGETEREIEREAYRPVSLLMKLPLVGGHWGSNLGP